jgi:hypothetical protein
MPTQAIGSKGQIKHYLSKDGRLIGMLIPGDFSDFLSFPPFVKSDEERRHLAAAYQVNVDREASTKAHLTADDLPLQIIVLEREPGSKVNPHYHVNDPPARSANRHQIMVCHGGSARIGLFTKDGERVDTVHVKNHDLILMTEGHAIEFVAPGTRLIEIKMGPFPESDAADKVEIDATF